jgi:hypothetical protein
VPSTLGAGPTFSGSADVGGADADLVVATTSGRVLVDVKATVALERDRRRTLYH